MDMKIKRHQRDSRPSCLLHDHPSGDPTPSQADIHMTKAIVQIVTPLGISVHDHIIVGKNGHTSLKGLKLIWLSPAFGGRSDLSRTSRHRRYWTHSCSAPRAA